MLSIRIDRRDDRTLVEIAGELANGNGSSDVLMDALAFVPLSDDLVVDVTGLRTLPEPCARRLRSSVAERAAGVDVEVVVAEHHDAARQLRPPSNGGARWTLTLQEPTTTRP